MTAAASLAEVGAGFDDGVLGTQAAFRSLLDAMARPGRVLRLPDDALRGLQPPASRQGAAPMGAATASLLLTLLDAETGVCLRGTLASDAARAWLRFHTGVQPTHAGGEAHVVIRAEDVDDGLWADLDFGSDEAPQRGATVLIEVPALTSSVPAGEERSRTVAAAGDAVCLSLRGPGIESVHGLVVAGLAESFWRRRIEMQADHPRGVDLVLVCETRLAALPRSTRVAVAA